MALFPDSVINGFKNVADGYGKLNEGQLALMHLLDPQFMNVFEILIYPQNFSLDIGSAAMAALDTVVARLHIQKMTIPFPKFIYEDYGGVKHLIDIEYPEEVTITFLENDLGIVRNYLQYWMNTIATFDPTGISNTMSKMNTDAGVFNPENLGNTDPFINPAMASTYKFKPNQLAAKRNAKIFLQMASGAPSPAGFVQIEGMKLKGIEDWEIAHDSQEPMMITATFAVDMIRLITAVTGFQ